MNQEHESTQSRSDDNQEQANHKKSELYRDLCVIRYGQFNKRRDFEFKLNISIWTVLAVIIGFIYNRAAQPNVAAPEIIIVSGIILLFVLYVILMWNLHKANHIDLSLAILAGELSEKFAGIEKIMAEKAKLGTWENSKTVFMSDNKKWTKKNFLLEISITFILAVLGITLAFRI